MNNNDGQNTTSPTADAEPSLGATTALDQDYAWDFDAGRNFYDDARRTSIHAAHEEARKALQALLKRLKTATAVNKLDGKHQ